MKALLIIWYIDEVTSYISDSSIKQLSINDFVVIRSDVNGYITRIGKRGQVSLFVGDKTIISKM